MEEDEEEEEEELPSANCTVTSKAGICLHLKVLDLINNFAAHTVQL